MRTGWTVVASAFLAVGLAFLHEPASAQQTDFPGQPEQSTPLPPDVATLPPPPDADQISTAQDAQEGGGDEEAPLSGVAEAP